MPQQMGGQPGASGKRRTPFRSFTRSGEAPWVRDGMRDPSIGVIVGFRSRPAVMRHLFQQVENGSLTILQPCRIGGPVVHLNIDVGMVVTIPWRLVFFGPKTL